MQTVTKETVEAIIGQAEIMLNRIARDGKFAGLGRLHSETLDLLKTADEASIINKALLEQSGNWVGDLASDVGERDELVVYRNDWDHRRAPERQRGEIGRAYSRQSALSEFNFAAQHVLKRAKKTLTYRPQSPDQKIKTYGQTDWQPALLAQ